ncbi:uncharacterized protein LOC118417528 [Branchiostoma floridae]|uniref:Uncharacterized protein LOC118417528 n=1 Tax=Branchiostoma floridae TaxID=7739 RepID=A0A9J7LBN8_BRAFL|nr:uncharacterized protein LOC118417528 [Branchiostoma floridae]
MALLKSRGGKNASGDWSSKPSWETRLKRTPQQRVPRETTKELIDYDQLSWLTNIPGLSSKYSPESSADAHRTFMENYHRMFLKPTPLSALPSKTASARSSYSKGPEKSKHTSLMSVGTCIS